jgi:hypothetical protein
MIRPWSTQSIESWPVSWSARRPIRACWRSSCSAARSAARPAEVAIRAAREFEDFKHIQRAYLDEVARG